MAEVNNPWIGAQPSPEERRLRRLWKSQGVSDSLLWSLSRSGAETLEQLKARDHWLAENVELDVIARIWRPYGLSSRATRRLAQLGCRTLDDVRRIGPGCVKADNIGRKTIAEIWRVLFQEELRPPPSRALDRFPDETLAAELRRRGYRCLVARG